MRRLILVALGFIAFQAYGQQVSINGSAPYYTGSKVVALQTLDFISDKREVIGVGEVVEGGTFKLTLDVDSPQKIDLQIDGVNASLHVRPNGRYDVFVPPLPVVKARTFSDSYVDIELNNLTKTDLNFSISRFNKRYEEFFGENYFELVKRLSSGNTKYMNSRAEQLAKVDMAKTDEADENTANQNPRDDVFLQKVDNFKNKVNTEFNTVFENNKHFKDYATYAIALLELQGGRLRAELYDKYLRVDDPLTNNSEYMNFVAAFYKDIFGEMARDGSSTIHRTINVNRSYTTMDETLKKEEFLSNDKLRSLVIVQGLKEAYKSGNFDTKAIVQILVEISESSIPEVSDIAKNTMSVMARGTKRHQLEDFKMLDENDKFVSLSDYKGQYVYIGFFASWCQSCVDELKLLEKFHIKYGDKMAFISISMDEEYTQYQAYLNGNQNQKWSFLYGPSEALTRDIFDLHSVSEYFLIDPEGKLVFPYTRKPSEGVSMDIEKLINKKPSGKGGNRIKVWDD